MFTLDTELFSRHWKDENVWSAQIHSVFVCARHRSSKTDTNRIIDGSKTSVYELITEDNVKVFTLITF